MAASGPPFLCRELVIAYWGIVRQLGNVQVGKQ